MKYTILVKSVGGSWGNWGKAAVQLAAEVNLAIREGWQPLGGVCSCCDAGITVMQAMTRTPATATVVGT